MWRFLLIPLAPVAAILASWPALAPAQPEARDDPFPIRRVVVPLDRLPVEMQRRGPLITLARDEFEAKVRLAAAAHQAMQRRPRLLKAFYAAEVSAQAL